MEWTVFSPEDAPAVFTAVSRECQRGDCDQCPGIFHLEQTGAESVFCVHACHLAPEVA
jgi:hypothetical protein